MLHTFNPVGKLSEKLLILLAAVVLLVLTSVFSPVLAHMPCKARRIIRWFLLSAILLLSLYFGLRMTSTNDTDLVYLRSAAEAWIRNGILPAEYFSTYPFQRFYTYMLVLVYRAGSLLGLDSLTSGTVFGAVLLTGSCFLASDLCRMRGKKGETASFAVLLLASTNPNILFYASYYYTYIPAAFLVLLFLRLVLVCAENGDARQYASYLTAGLFLHTGYQFRATCAIAGIAFTLWLLFDRRKMTQKLKLFSLLLIGILISSLMWRLIDNHFAPSLDSEMAFPVSSWIAMGLNL